MKPAICVTENVKAYRQGKRDFSVSELGDIKLYFLKYKEQLENTQFFEGKIKNFKTVSCFAEDYHEELFNYILNSNNNTSIAIIIKLSTKSVLFKKNSKVCDIDLAKLASLLCDGAGLSDGTAVGKFTAKFLTFTKTLTPCI